MDEATFWAIIDRIDRARIAYDESAAVEPLVDALTGMARAEIASFEDHLARRLRDLDTPRHAGEAGESSGSAEAFLHARCFVVAQGEAHFRAVLADPSQMPRSSDEWCEALLGVATAANENANGVRVRFVTTVIDEGRVRGRFR
ncbi:MAG: DUF4240 domain-containing protein [Polyangiaceae bacterium]|nr:DUF4240 domain-containing protein [Polyangiaceae bacterium]